VRTSNDNEKKCFQNWVSLYIGNFSELMVPPASHLLPGKPSLLIMTVY